MATVILEHHGKRRGGVLQGRMSIGRRPGSSIFIDDESVSPIHAWIGRVGHTYFVADVGSLTGTMVNGMPVAGRRTLRDGDEILVGPAKLIFQSDAPLPAGIEPLMVTVRVRAEPDQTVARPARVEPATQEATCGACQSPIVLKEPMTACPECGVAFHANCWIENRGCSSYGCKQVGILNSATAPKPASADGTPVAEHSAENSRRAQWSYLLLPASGLAGLAGMFAFGIPSLGLLVGLILYAMRHPGRIRWVFAGSEIFSAVAAMAGAAFSTYWWLLPAAGMGRQ
jgi:hypothetical protein